MDRSPSNSNNLIARLAAKADLRKLLRYSAVSVVSIPLTQLLLFLFYEVLGWGATWSNFWAVTLTSIPAYFMNRAWVWGKSGSHDLRGEVLPFWLVAIAGLALSMVFVAWAEKNIDSSLAVYAANIAAFGVVWIVKFIILEKHMFGAHTHTDASSTAPDSTETAKSAAR
ncbi:MAG: GtrA family protein [Acidimicrobiia bacterium]|jgi:putative flippase GtrA|nr:GtrA family protein [Acidimicrobiia bacterium]MBP8180297.1 GtrA family protein [Acidimicrobiia bacterium]